MGGFLLYSPIKMAALSFFVIILIYLFGPRAEVGTMAQKCQHINGRRVGRLEINQHLSAAIADN